MTDRQLGNRGSEHPDYYEELLACWRCGYDPAERREEYEMPLCQNCYDEMKENDDTIQRTD